MPGTTDQVDVDVTVVEKNTGNLLAGVGYSSADGVVFNASISQQNIFGTGNALSLAINTSKINRTISLAFTEPYWTVDGISRTLEIYHKNIDPTSLAVSQYSSSTLGAAIELRHPDHRNRHDQRRVPRRAHEPDAVPEQPADLLRVRARVRLLDQQLHRLAAAGRVTPATTSSILRWAGCRAALAEVGAAVRRPRRTTSSTTCNQWFWPVYGDFVLMLRARPRLRRRLRAASRCRSSRRSTPAAWARCAATSTASLGPRDIYGNALGGKRKIVGNVELFYPILKGDKSVRVSVFVDAGQIYVDGDSSPSSRIVPLLGGRGRRLELADRAAQVQLRASRSTTKPARQDPALPVPGRHGVLDRDRRRRFT